MSILPKCWTLKEKQWRGCRFRADTTIVYENRQFGLVGWSAGRNRADTTACPRISKRKQSMEYFYKSLRMYFFFFTSRENSKREQFFFLNVRPKMSLKIFFFFVILHSLAYTSILKLESIRKKRNDVLFVWIFTSHFKTIQPHSWTKASVTSGSGTRLRYWSTNQPRWLCAGTVVCWHRFPGNWGERNCRRLKVGTPPEKQAFLSWAICNENA